MLSWYMLQIWIRTESRQVNTRINDDQVHGHIGVTMILRKSSHQRLSPSLCYILLVVPTEFIMSLDVMKTKQCYAVIL